MSVEINRLAIDIDPSADFMNVFGRLSKWDGDAKDSTKGCLECPLRRRADEIDWCCWGIANKSLFQDHRKALRKCSLDLSKSPRLMALQRRQEWERLQGEQRPII